MLFISKEWRTAAQPCSIAYSLKDHEQIIESTNQLHLKAVTTDDKIVGFIVLEGIQNINQSIQINQLVIHPTNQGFGSQAVEALKKYAFLELDLHRISVEIFSYHTPAIQLFESKGFQVEGVLRDAKLDENGFQDLTVLSILSSQ